MLTQQVSRAMENAMASILQAMRTAQQTQQEWAGNLKPQSLCNAITAQNYQAVRLTSAGMIQSPWHQACVRDLLAGFHDLGCVTAQLEQNQPDQISHYAQAVHLNTHQPNIILLVDRLRADVPGLIPDGCVAISWFRELSDDDSVADAPIAAALGPQDFIFTERRDHHAQLLQMGHSPKHVKPVGFAVNTALFHPIPPEQIDARYRCDVVMIGDRPSTDPEFYNIQLPTHQLLWQTVLKDIAESPQHYSYGKAQAVLDKAQRCGVQLTEEKLRSQFIQWIENYAAPAALKDAYGLALHHAGVDLAVWSWTMPRSFQEARFLEFWQQSPLKGHLRGAIDRGPGLSACYNGAKIAVHLTDTGRMDQTLLNGIASGALMLVRRSPQMHTLNGIGKYFDLEKELLTFDTPKELLQKVRYYLGHPKERQELAAKAAQKAHALYSTTQRCLEMLTHIAATLKK